MALLGCPVPVQVAQLPSVCQPQHQGTHQSDGNQEGSLRAGQKGRWGDGCEGAMPSGGDAQRGRCPEGAMPSRGDAKRRRCPAEQMPGQPTQQRAGRGGAEPRGAARSRPCWAGRGGAALAGGARRGAGSGRNAVERP